MGCTQSRNRDILGQITSNPIGVVGGQLGHDEDAVIGDDDLGGLEIVLGEAEGRGRKVYPGPDMRENIGNMPGCGRFPEGPDGLIAEGVEVVYDEEDGENDEECGRGHAVHESHLCIS